MNKVYKIKFPNGKIYLGVTSTTFASRFAAHKHAKYVVGKAIRKYGITVSSMEELFVGTEEECYELEQLVVDESWVLSKENYNMCLGGCKPPGVSMKGSDNPMWKGGSFCITCGTSSRGTNCTACHKALKLARVNYCKCGCNTATSRPEYEYVRGHKPTVGRLCRCGCGERTGSRSTHRIQGH